MAPRTVQISDVVYEHVATHGKFGESVDDVLRRLLGLDEATSTRHGRSDSSASQGRRSRQATTRMSARVEAEQLVVEFRGGPRRTWRLPASRTGQAVANLSGEARTWAEAQGATYGQSKAVHKALTNAGFYNTGPR